MELKFAVDTKHRKGWFTGISFSHPAKMSLPLQLWIIENYTKVGDVILDPMAGSGTILVACSMGRNVIAVELEQKFIDMMHGNWEKIKQRGAQLGYSMGMAQIIRGDARQLGGLLVDKIITSPPYSDISMGGGLNTKPPREGKDDQSGRSPDSPSQKGLVDKIITSPPYAESTHHSDDPKAQEKFRPGRTGACAGTAGEDEGNIGNLSYGDIDAVITSPPYEGQVSGGGQGINWGKGTEYGKPRDRSKDASFNLHYGKDFEYSKSENNIGNLKSQSYLEAMLAVYRQCFAVLKSGGLLILVTKNFIRQKKVIRLDLDTIKLCEQAGFGFVERRCRKLPAQSFWRIIYMKKHPEVEPIEYEDILVFKKEVNND